MNNASTPGSYNGYCFLWLKQGEVAQSQTHTNWDGHTRVFSQFDDMCKKCTLAKIMTVGDRIDRE